jgi:hypothetical protein
MAKNIVHFAHHSKLSASEQCSASSVFSLPTLELQDLKEVRETLGLQERLKDQFLSLSSLGRVGAQSGQLQHQHLAACPVQIRKEGMTAVLQYVLLALGRFLVDDPMDTLPHPGCMDLILH